MKIFNIGAHKTGTGSVKKALEQLGFGPVAGWGLSNHLIPNYINGDYESILNFAEKYGAFKDSPWCFGDLYVKIYEKFPSSKFILTERNPEKWFASFLTWHSKIIIFGSNGWPLVYKPYLLLYNMDKSMPMTPNNILKQKNIIIESFTKRNDMIKKFFINKPESFIVMNVCDNKDGWNILCPFLGKSIPKQLFPLVNKSKDILARKK